MGKFTAPDLENILWKKVKNKNYIKQFLDYGIEIEISLLDNGRSYVVIGNLEGRVCITCNENNFPESEEYVLLSNKKPTIEKLEKGEIKIKKWLKHPKMAKHSIPEIISSWESDFTFLEEDLEKNISGLRIPQISGLFSIISHLKVSDETGIVVMPTGTGKTETMLSALISHKCEKLLVTVPSDALRNQIYKKFLTLGLLKEFGIVGEKSLYPRDGTHSPKANFNLRCFADNTS